MTKTCLLCGSGRNLVVVHGRPIHLCTICTDIFAEDARGRREKSSDHRHADQEDAE